MSTTHSSRNRSGDRQHRIDDLKRQVKEAANGNLTAWESDALSPAEKELFWRHVVQFETAPSTTDLEQLAEAGLELPAPNAVGDKQLAALLCETIEALARMRVFITNTDHLSDRELYSWLWHDALRDEVPKLPNGPGGAWHVDVLGGCSDEDTTLYLKFYADEAYRAQWLADFPDYAMPAHEEPPYDRDRHLPKPW